MKYYSCDMNKPASINNRWNKQMDAEKKEFDQAVQTKPGSDYLENPDLKNADSDQQPCSPGIYISSLPFRKQKGQRKYNVVKKYP